MISNVSAFLSNVYNLNHSKGNNRTSSKEDKDTGSSSFEVQDVVEITSRKAGSYLSNNRLDNKEVQKDTVSQKTDIQNTGERRLEDTRLNRQEDNREGTPVQTAAHQSEQEKKEVAALRKRDIEVRQHEQAHLAAAGKYASGLSLTTRMGPDGRHYAVGGEVSIDLSAVPGDPDATIAKALAIRRAANAPANPSRQDRLVAAEATRMEAKARLEKIQQEKQPEGEGPTVPNDINNIVEKLMEDGNPDQAIRHTSQTSSRAVSAYGNKDSEIGNILNKVI